MFRNLWKLLSMYKKNKRCDSVEVVEITISKSVKILDGYHIHDNDSGYLLYYNKIFDSIDDYHVRIFGYDTDNFIEKHARKPKDVAKLNRSVRFNFEKKPRNVKVFLYFFCEN